MTWEKLTSASQLDIKIVGREKDLPEDTEPGEIRFVAKKNMLYVYDENEEGENEWQQSEPAQQAIDTFEYELGGVSETLSLQEGEVAFDAIERNWEETLRFSDAYVDALTSDTASIDELAPQNMITKKISKTENPAWNSFYSSDQTMEKLTGYNNHFYFILGRGYIDHNSEKHDFNQEEVSPEKFDTPQSIPKDRNAMDTIANSDLAMDVLSPVPYSYGIEKFMEWVLGSEEAMNAVSSFETSWNLIWDNRDDGAGYEYFWSQILGGSMPVGKFALGRAFLDESEPHPEDFRDVTEIVNSQSAMEIIAKSDKAMSTIASSDTAISIIEDEWNQKSLSDGESLTVAPVYLAEVQGGGGGGADGDSDDNGDSGESSEFGSAFAGGGSRGRFAGENGSCGGFDVTSETSALVEGNDCGGGSGGNGTNGGGDGGNGGSLKALVSNSELDEITAVVGNGGDGGGSGSSGGSGNIIVWVPSWAED